MNRCSLCDALILWVNTFDIPQTVYTASDFSDGFVAALLLNQIDSHYFNDTWFQDFGISEDTGVKISNLKNLLDSLLSFFAEVLLHPVINFTLPNIHKIASDKADENELTRLLQLIILCAVNCENKQHFISKIMQLDEYTQHMLMNAIKEITYDPVSYSDEDSDTFKLKVAIREINRLLSVQRESETTCSSLRSAIKALEDEKLSISAANASLLERMENLESFDKTLSENKQILLGKQLAEANEEIFKLETALQQQNVQVSALEKSNEQLIQKSSELASISEKCELLTDEVDFLAQELDSKNKLIDTLQQRINQCSENKERANTTAVRNGNISQEESCADEKDRNQFFAFALKKYRNLVQELSEKNANAIVEIDHLKYEKKRCEQLIEGLKNEKEHLLKNFETLNGKYRNKMVGSYGTQNIPFEETLESLEDFSFFENSSFDTTFFDENIAAKEKGRPKTLDMDEYAGFQNSPCDLDQEKNFIRLNKARLVIQFLSSKLQTLSADIERERTKKTRKDIRENIYKSDSLEKSFLNKQRNMFVNNC